MGTLFRRQDYIAVVVCSHRPATNAGTPIDADLSIRGKGWGVMGRSL
ncbi:MAG: hypothetical protein V7K14_07320 [Nostoc sp.]